MTSDPPSAEAVCSRCGQPLRTEHYGTVRHHDETEGHVFEFRAEPEADAAAPAPAAPSAPQPEEAVPGAVEALRKRLLIHIWDGGSPGVQFEGERALDALIAAVRAEPPREEGGEALEALREALGIIKRTASDPWNYDGKIVELAEAALAAARAPGPAEPGGE